MTISAVPADVLAWYAAGRPLWLDDSEAGRAAFKALSGGLQNLHVAEMYDSGIGVQEIARITGTPLDWVCIIAHAKRAPPPGVA